MKNKGSIKVDTHAHVFNGDLLFVKQRRYTPNYHADLSSYLAYLDKYQFTHGVLIQPSFLGTDNSFMIEAIKQAPSRLKGVAVVEPNISRSELQKLADSGIVGIRLNLIGQSLPDLSLPVWQTLLSYLRELNWHVEFHCQSEFLADLLPFFIMHNVRVVVDHFGRPLQCNAVQDSGFLELLKMAESELVWIKLSAMYRVTHSELEEALYINEVIPKLLDVFGADRLMWGSDWPHTQHEKKVSYDIVANAIDEWLPDLAVRKKILCDTPAEFFGFN